MNRDADSLRLSHRALLQRAGLAGAVLASVQLTGCSDTSSSQPTASAPTTSGSSSPTTTSASGGEAAGTRPASSTASAGGGGASVLLAYFSRAGENYFNGGRTFLDVGNTQVVAELIQAAIPVDVYLIEPGATITDGLAVRGEEAADAGGDVDAWLRRLGLLAA